MEKGKKIILPYYINCNEWDRQYEKLVDGLSIFDINNVMLIGDLNARVGD